MKVLYDLRLLQPRMHGMARYALELLKAMLRVGDDLSLAALVRRPEQASLLPQHPGLVVLACNIPPYGIAAQLAPPIALTRLNVDLYHCPFYAPLSRLPGPKVVSIHDLIHLRFPADYKLKHRLFYRWVLGPLARKVPAVLTGSEHSKQDMVELLGVDPERIKVTPYGVGPQFRPLDQGAKEAAARHLKLPAGYILGVGNPKPHKNLAALVRAYDDLCRDLPPGVDSLPALALLGVDQGQVKAEAAAGQVICLPQVAEEDLPQLYAAAGMVVIPSLYEGFGLPALEAMASGAPLISSNRASLPEVVGQSGLLVEPEPRALTEAMGRVLADEGLREGLAQTGPRRAAWYTWEQTARATLDVYRRAARGRDPA